MWESVISETIYLKEGITKVALIGVSMAIEAKTWHLVFFLAVFVGYRNKTPDNIGGLYTRLLSKTLELLSFT